MGTARRFLISGRVQGVGFRYFAYELGQRLGLVGFVRNLPDGRVEACAEGDLELLQQFHRELGRGPRWATVADIRVEEVEASGKYHRFQIEGW
ncbi:MAG: acylphosphatase [Acidobacteria bacterium]|nr:acylphosphatase [Acidobacteriota bacterium]